MRILVTAGPTREALDPVRFISNRSTGKMGYAVAVSSAERGHDVILISGPVSLPKPEGIRVVDVVSAADMLAAVEEHFPWCEALVMAAAVADWRPAIVHATKQKKSAMEAVLPLERTTDILCAIRGRKEGRTVVGFAAETDHCEAEAQRKLKEKGLDAIVLNDVTKAGAGFAVDTNILTWMGIDGVEESWPLLQKSEAAVRILERVEALHEKGLGIRDLGESTSCRRVPGHGSVT